jgi:hypothetical protein
MVVEETEFPTKPPRATERDDFIKRQDSMDTVDATSAVDATDRLPPMNDEPNTEMEFPPTPNDPRRDIVDPTLTRLASEVVEPESTLLATDNDDSRKAVELTDRPVPNWVSPKTDSVLPKRAGSFT